MNIKSWSVEVLMNFSTTAHFIVRNSSVGWVMVLNIGQAPTSIADDSIGPFIMGLIEDSPQARPTSICVQLEGPGKVGIDQNRCCGT